jgi:hypothetical protein
MEQAGDILAIGASEAAKLFPGNDKQVRRRYVELVRAWHPDTNHDPQAGRVFAHLHHLHDIVTGKARPHAAAGAPIERRWKRKDGGETVVRAKAIHQRATGDVIVTAKTVAYEAVAGYEDIANAEAARVDSFRFADDGMRKGIEKFLPKLERRIDAVGVSVNVFSRPGDTVLLADLARHMGGRIPPAHVAWIVSSLLNMANYLNWLGLSHGAISPDHVLVCPAMHSIVLVGGWGYATPFGKRPSALPAETLSLVPRLAVPGETVGPALDLTLVRAVAKELLGSSAGGGLAMMKDVPDALRTWLTMPPAATALEDYRSWEECLTKSFGPRKFVRMEVNPADVYTAAN